MKSFVLFVGMLLLIPSVSAMNPTQGYCQNVDPSVCGWGGGSQPARRVINIPSHYGAVAFDGDRGVIGSSENNLKSMRSAKKEALQNCIAHGGSKNSCQIITYTRNGCNALALGGKGSGGIVHGAARPVSQEAEDAALQGCKKAGGEKCFIAYSQCSRDPRYQVGK